MNSQTTLLLDWQLPDQEQWQNTEKSGHKSPLFIPKYLYSLRKVYTLNNYVDADGRVYMKVILLYRR
jgi:hypothetical protein